MNQFFAAFIGGAVSTALALFAFYFKEFWSKDRDYLFSVVDLIVKNIDELTALSEQYWSNDGDFFETDVSSEIVYKLHDLSKLVEFLREFGIPVGLDLSSPLHNFHRATTGGDFKVKSRSRDLDRVLMIRSRAMELRISVMRVKRRKHAFFR